MDKPNGGSGLVGPNGLPLDVPPGAYVKDGNAKCTIAEAFAIVHQESPKILGPIVERMATDMAVMRADVTTLKAVVERLAGGAAVEPVGKRRVEIVP